MAARRSPWAACQSRGTPRRSSPRPGRAGRTSRGGRRGVTRRAWTWLCAAPWFGSATLPTEPPAQHVHMFVRPFPVRFRIRPRVPAKGDLSGLRPGPARFGVRGDDVRQCREPATCLPDLGNSPDESLIAHVREVSSPGELDDFEVVSALALRAERIEPEQFCLDRFHAGHFSASVGPLWTSSVALHPWPLRSSWAG